MTRVMYSAMDAIHAYGIESFAALIRENLVVGLDGVNVEVFDDANFYRVFAYAYIAGAMSGSSQVFLEAFGVDNVEPLDLQTGPLVVNWNPPGQPEDIVGFTLGDDDPNDLIDNDFSTFILPFTIDSTEADTVEVTSRYVELLNKELFSQTGLVSVIKSMFPGKYVDYRGDDLFTMVVVCDV
ncbi:hypothetical protein pEaSNUABM38_00013 [Erwinia phage pEa_SNUABM_38]|nr:hypothetical protein pEaSNUABM38_00013 [Erwinia phage pEa_SNUABM_38]